MHWWLKLIASWLRMMWRCRSPLPIAHCVHLEMLCHRRDPFDKLVRSSWKYICCPVAILMKTYRACLSCKMRMQQELLEYLVNFWLHSTMLSTSLKSMVHVKTWKIKNSGNSGSLPLITPSILDDNWIRTFTWSSLAHKISRNTICTTNVSHSRLRKIAQQLELGSSCKALTW